MLWRRIHNYFLNEGAKVIVMVLWLGINSALFYFTFEYYYYGPEFYYLHEILGYGLCISRATAACINLNACFILLPMCRNVLGILRGFPKSGRILRRLLDRSKSFHISCAYILCLMAAVHCGAHTFNAFNFSKYFNRRYLEVNVASFAHQNPFVLIVTSVPGITGLCMVALLTVIAVTASSPLRRSNFRRFWKMHHFFIGFYILLLLHASRGILKYQSNVNEHIPGCYIRGKGNSSEMVVIPEPEPEAEPSKINMIAQNDIVVVPEIHSIPEGEPLHHPMPEGQNIGYVPCGQPDPQFKSCPTEAWRWMMIPLLLYTIERLHRYFGGRGKLLSLTKVVKHKQGVVEMEFYHPTLKAKPGQSIWLRCPTISAVEEHPFTLTSVPSENHPYFTIHMLERGEWTKRLNTLLSMKFEKIELDCSSHCTRRNVNHKVTSKSEVRSVGDVAYPKTNHISVQIVDSADSIHSNSDKIDNPMQIFAFGPYGTPMTDVFQYPISICIAGGIGITPFAAILNLIQRRKNTLEKQKLRRIYLIWMSRNMDSFRLFIDLINSVQYQLWDANKPDFLNVYLHMTSAKSEEQESLLVKEQCFSRCRLEAGRPNLTNVFDQISERHKKTSVGVFCCGPKSLNHSVQRHCMRSHGRNGAHFIFNKESFG